MSVYDLGNRRRGAVRPSPVFLAFVANLMAHRPQISKRDARRVIVELVFLTILNERLSSIARRADAPFLAASASVVLHELTRDNR